MGLGKGLPEDMRAFVEGAPREIFETEVQRTLDKLEEWIEACRKDAPVGFIFSSLHVDAEGNQAIQVVNIGEIGHQMALYKHGMGQLMLRAMETSLQLRDRGAQ